MTFGEKVKLKRTKAGLTQQELADALNVSRRMIAAYECGEAVARPDKVEMMEKLFNVPVGYFNDKPRTRVYNRSTKSRARWNGGSKLDRKFVSPGGYVTALVDGEWRRIKVDRLLQDSKALFMGDDLSAEQKQQFFREISDAYFDSNCVGSKMNVKG